MFTLADGEIGLLHLELGSFVNVLRNGETSEEACQFVYGGRLLALEKKSGGVRTIEKSSFPLVSVARTRSACHPTTHSKCTKVTTYTAYRRIFRTTGSTEI